MDKNVLEMVVGKRINRLYYLTEECAAFDLFDESIDVNTRVMMARNTRKQTEIDVLKFTQNNLTEK